MASFVFLDANVIINSVDLSDHVRSLTLNYGADMQEDSAMQGSGTRSRVAGLLDWSFNITFKQNFDAGKVDATLFPLVGAAAFAVAVRAFSTAVSATNPEFQGNGVIETYPPLAGAVGELNEAQVTIQAAGPLTRATS